ncbi:MAG: hypothetical protein ACK5XZ_10375 [Hyphomonadaceae bacterium]
MEHWGVAAGRIGSVHTMDIGNSFAVSALEIGLGLRLGRVEFH